MILEDRLKFLEVLVKSGAKIGNVVIGDHSNINFYAGKSEPPSDENKKDGKVDLAILKRCVEKVSWMFWEPCAITVVFCVCCRCFGYENNMAQFERDFGCKEDLLSRTLRNHPYMRLKLNEWKSNGAKDRELRLLKAYQNAVNEELAK